eukprot:CAMPEP_0197479002 /NCGR_PEP_ID=MMETSP1309-20131121/30825_1 /TAXON_ID=464262 /ORGANISM="Genus nov. species nov., Strain RCC998" /LENGTH=247 /DNA_ID=CAMNT_0043020569 /DNA_START=614 /DNA_END=1357 /DNA_ORIENTATION=+
MPPSSFESPEGPRRLQHARVRYLVLSPDDCPVPQLCTQRQPVLRAHRWKNERAFRDAADPAVKEDGRLERPEEDPSTREEVVANGPVGEVERERRLPQYVGLEVHEEGPDGVFVRLADLVPQVVVPFHNLVPLAFAALASSGESLCARRLLTALASSVVSSESLKHLDLMSPTAGPPSTLHISAVLPPSSLTGSTCVISPSSCCKALATQFSAVPPLNTIIRLSLSPSSIPSTSPSFSLLLLLLLLG